VLASAYTHIHTHTRTHTHCAFASLRAKLAGRKGDRILCMFTCDCQDFCQPNVTEGDSNGVERGGFALGEGGERGADGGGERMSAGAVSAFSVLEPHSAVLARVASVAASSSDAFSLR